MGDSFPLEDENVKQPSPRLSGTAQANASSRSYERHSISYETTTFVMPQILSDDWEFLGNELPWPEFPRIVNQQVSTAHEHIMEGSVVDQNQHHQVPSDTEDSNPVHVSPSMLALGSTYYDPLDIQPQVRHNSLVETIDEPPASIGSLHAAILSDDDPAQVPLVSGDEVQQNVIAAVLRTDDAEGYIITCLDPLCGAKTFARFQEFTRHDKSFHRHIGPEIWCPVKHCERSNALGHKGFPSVRKDKLREHVRLMHGFELAE